MKPFAGPQRRTRILAGAVLALLIANVWHWWPRDARDPRSSAAAPQSVRGEQLELKVASAMVRNEVRRDLFQPKARAGAVAATPSAITGPAAHRPEPVKAPPSPSPEQTARAEIAQIKVIGVVFRNGRYEAYLTRGDINHIAYQGARVADRYVVESIGTDSVRIRDERANVVGEVPVLGR